MDTTSPSGDNGAMWLCFNDGFVSVVADKNNLDRLLVRARRKQDLLNVCGKDVEALKDAGTDYRWRTFVDRKAFSAWSPVGLKRSTTPISRTR